MVELAVLLVLQLAGLLWSLWRFLRWIQCPESAPRKVVWILAAVLPGLVIALALVALLWYMGPISSHRTFGVQALGAPDQMLLLGSSIVLALIGAILQLFGAVWLWRRRTNPLTS